MLKCDQNHLLVEDIDTRGVVRGLMGHYIDWGKDEDAWPVRIEVCDGNDDVLDRKYLKEKLKEGRLEAIGIIVDADDNCRGRWESIRDLISNLGGNSPKNCPREGLKVNIKGKRFGVWIMPDNKTDGMVESFCHTLIPDESRKLWEYAKSCANEAKMLGAPFADIHFDKAHIQTWLAWQEPPGIRMGVALTQKILHHGTAEAKAFAGWFMDLFNIDPKAEK